MKRDLELIIAILKQVEANEDMQSGIIPDSDNHSYEHVQYNVDLMEDAGLIEMVQISRMMLGKPYKIRRLTWLGHDFLDAARNEAVVEKAKESAKNKGFDFKSLPLNIAKDLLTESIKHLLF